MLKPFAPLDGSSPSVDIKDADPAFLRGFIWNKNEICSSPTAMYSLTAPPLPGPQRRQSLSPELQQTMRMHSHHFRVVTPIKVDIFERLLKTHPNRPFVISVVRGLREGFWPPGAVVDYTKNPVTNDASRGPPRQPERLKFLIEQRDKEIDSGRYSEAIGSSLPLGMYCMPVHVQDNGKKLRLISDHSAGQFSLNEMIPKGERSAVVDRMDSFGKVMLSARSIAGRAPLTLWKSDVAQAFRLIPMHPNWQAFQVVKISGKYYVDRCNTFGNAASSRLFCAFYSLVLWIAENVRGISDVLAYVDDNFSWEFRGCERFYAPYGVLLPEKQARLLELWDEIGIPHERKKQEHGLVLTIIGYDVDINGLRMKVPPAEMAKLAQGITEICSVRQKSAKHLDDLIRLAGSLNWAIDVNPLLRPGLSSLQWVIADGSNATAERLDVGESLEHDLRWVQQHLTASNGISLKDARRWEAKEAYLSIYCDACLQGFGFWTPNTREAFIAKNPEGAGLDIVFFEMFAVLCAIHWAASGYLSVPRKRAYRLAVYTDSPNTFHAFNNMYAKKGYNHLLMLAADILIEKKIDLRVYHITGEKNFIADNLSREKFSTLGNRKLTIKRFSVPGSLRGAARRA